ncbi:LRRN4 C-terminal-like protein [Osmerus mordax]|uniref:LRRN4 C-terminal-like protein n=1 Tax=Osmerus mordax TaxID=8014 RepID=UPI00350F02EC
MMKSPCWNLAMVFLLLTPELLYFLSSSLLTQAIPTHSPVTPHRILYVTDVGGDDYNDYGDGDDHSPSPSKISPTVKTGPELSLCDYDPCMAQQVPCNQLSAQDGCLCPGLSGPDKIPHPPLLKKLVPADGEAKGVEVWWCAPESVVSKYQVVVEGHEGQPLNFGEKLRSGLVGELQVGARVCVVAENEAGTSTPVEYSCQTYDPPEATNLALRAGVIGVGLGLLLLLSLSAVICWRRQSCRKAGRNSTEGLGNPSYSTEGTF